MSAMDGINNSILQSQLSAMQIRQAIDVKVAAKTMDMARDQGQAVLKLLDSAMQVSNAADKTPTFGQLASGLGMNLDVKA